MRAIRWSGWRRWRVVVGAGAVLAASCGDPTGPADHPPDLEFTLPATLAVGEYRQDTLSSGFAARVPGMVDSWDESDGSAFPTVDFYKLLTWFSGSVYVVEYSLYGSGTGYTIAGNVSVLGPGGSSVLSRQLNGLSEDAGWPTFINPHGREQYNTGLMCGAVASANANFEIRISLPGLGKFAFVRTMRFADSQTRQAACSPPPPPPAGSGGGGQGSDEDLYLCWYNVWVDATGRIVEIEETSCQKIGQTEM